MPLETTENDQKKFCVYLHINKINGKIYVGQTCKVPTARWQNGTGYRTQKHFWASICKYGWDNFEHKIVASMLTQNEANTIEKMLIEKLDTMNPNKGYNKDSGGNGERFVSEETKRKISLSHIGEKNPMFGKHMSKENREIRSEKWKGSNNPSIGKVGKDAHHITPVYKIDKETNEILCRYDTINEAEQDTGASHGNIIRCCTGDRKTAAGFKWSYIN